MRLSIYLTKAAPSSREGGLDESDEVEDDVDVSVEEVEVLTVSNSLEREEAADIPGDTLVSQVKLPESDFRRPRGIR